MARGLNKAMVIGNLGQSPEVKYMPGGDPVVNVSIATSESWKDKNTGERKERTEWHRVVFYRGLAKVVGEYLHKGSKVYVEGKLQTRKWTASDGTDRYSTEIIAADMQMLDSRTGGQSTHDEGAPAAAAAATPPPATNQEFEDDIPF